MNQNVQKLLAPRSVAVIGASQSPEKVGNVVVRNLIASGFTGPIYPINPKATAIAGIRCYAKLNDLPGPVDLAVICTPAPTVADIVDQCGQRNFGGVLVLSAGFRESGPEGKRLEQALAGVLSRYPDMRMIGPNCLGLMNPTAKLNASFARGFPEPGRLAFISQSGALCTAILDWALEQHIGFSVFASLGNMLNVGFSELLDYVATDPTTDAVILYIESIPRGRQFLEAARQVASRKPLIAYKAGRFAESAKAASSHTGALVGDDDVYQTAFDTVGIIRARTVLEMFDCAEILTHGPRPNGNRLAIVTNAGGPGVMASDALIGAGGKLAELSNETIAKLSAQLPEHWSHGNPVDVLGDATPDRYAKALETVLADLHPDAVLVLLTPQAMTEPTQTASLVARVASTSKKPVLACWMGAGSVREGAQLLQQSGISVYPTPETAVRAFVDLAGYVNAQRAAHDAHPLTAATPVEPALREVLSFAQARGAAPLSEVETKRILAIAGIPVCETIAAADAKAACAAAQKLGYPVVIKINSPQISHKTDVGGVVVDIVDEPQLRKSMDVMFGRVKSLRPDAQIQGVSVQPYLREPGTVEMILGAKRDPVFGTTIMMGLGGTSAELMPDVQILLPPLTSGSVEQALRKLRCWPLLDGYRGREKADVANLIQTVLKFSRLAAGAAEICELEINPLLVGPRGAVALDARAVFG